MIAIEDISDDHLHTTVSDGDLDPDEVLRYLAPRARGPISITDHDTLGVHKRPETVALARQLSVELVPGIEMDADFDGIEMHVLGFNVDVRNGPLNVFLDEIAAARRQRAREELAIVNGLLGEGTFREGDIFKPGRETLMKPHFIKPLLAKGLFPEYRAAMKWYKANVKPATVPRKPPFAEVAALLAGAGAIPVLAHPGYYIEDHGLPIESALARMKADGLGGVEVDYPYHERSRNLFSPESATAMVEKVRAATTSAGLRSTRGTDCHSVEDYRESYP